MLFYRIRRSLMRWCRADNDGGGLQGKWSHNAVLAYL